MKTHLFHHSCLRILLAFSAPAEYAPFYRTARHNAPEMIGELRHKIAPVMPVKPTLHRDGQECMPQTSPPRISAGLPTTDDGHCQQALRSEMRRNLDTNHKLS